MIIDHDGGDDVAGGDDYIDDADDVDDDNDDDGDDDDTQRWLIALAPTGRLSWEWNPML